MEQKSFIEGEGRKGSSFCDTLGFGKKIAKAAVSGLQTYKFCGLYRS